MSVMQLWPTNVLYEKVAPETTQDFLDALVSKGNEYEEQFPEAHVPVLMRKSAEASYNLLQDPSPQYQFFKAMLKQRIIEIATAEGFLNPENVQFEAVCKMRRFGPNEYAKPHNHRSVDYIAVYFISLAIDEDKFFQATHQTMAGNRLHLIDPMPMRSRFLNHNMLHAISPVPGTFVIHPAGTFHTTELNLTDKDLIALVTNVKVVDPVRNYERL